MTDKQIVDALKGLDCQVIAGATRWPNKSEGRDYTKDFTAGNRAACLGMEMSTCPILPPQRRKQWLKGWRTGRAFLNLMNWIFDRRRRSKSR